MFNRGDNRGFDLINHAIRMGTVGGLLGPKNAELLRDLSDANLIARSVEMPSPSGFQQASATVKSTSKPTVQKPASSNSNSFQFPWKLHDMLDNSAKEGLDDIVSWQDEGRAFRVHRPKEFVEHVMCRYFKQTKYKSFQRQLNLYGFSRINEGPSKGGYKHPLFRRGHREKCELISRNSGGDSMPAGSDEGRISTAANETIRLDSLVENSPSPPREAFLPFAPFASAAASFEVSTPNAMSPISPKVATISVSSSSSESGDADATPNEDQYRALLHKEYQFPWRLYEMLDRSEMDSFEHIVGWLGDSCFKVHDPSLFVTIILPRYFRQTKYKSFQRQLNLYGFARVENGPNKGGYRHPCFLKGKRELLDKMARLKQEKICLDDDSSHGGPSSRQTEKDQTQGEALRPHQICGIPAILAAIECAEAASDGGRCHVVKLGHVQPAHLNWRRDPRESFSDWTIEVIDKVTRTTDQYHVHRRILAAGPRRSEFFARLFEQRHSAQKSVLELGHIEAHVFPLMLDHIYTDLKLQLETETAYALYSLADQLEIHSILHSVTDFYISIMTKENAIDLLVLGESFNSTILLDAALDKCAEELHSMDIVTSSKIKPTLFLAVMQRSRNLTKRFKFGSSRLSQLVAACVEANLAEIGPELFQQLTDKEYLPYIESIAAIKLLAAEQHIFRRTIPSGVQFEDTLRGRCLNSIVSDWSETKVTLHNDEYLSNQMKSIPSDLLYEILMKTTPSLTS